MKRLVLLMLISLMFTGCVKAVDLTKEEELILADQMAKTVLSNTIKEVEDKDNKSDDKAGKELDGEDLEERKPDQSKENQESTNMISDKSLNSWDYNKDLKIKLMDYEIIDNFPNDSGEFYHIQPKENEHFLLVTFAVKNYSDQEAIFNTLNNKISFYLMNADTSYKPLQTFLPNDIQFMNLNLSSNQEQSMILLYSIPKDINLDQLSLTMRDHSLSQEEAVTFSLK